MLKEERLELIIKMLAKKKVLTIKDVAQALQTSSSTIRRDFDTLCEHGDVKRVHGGIASLHQIGEKQLTGTALVKDRLCHMVAAHIEEGSCIFVDGGTTFRTLLDHLKDKKVKIVTNNHLLVANQQQGKAEVIYVGGIYDYTYYVSTGSMTLETISQFSFDVALITCEGYAIEENSLYAADVNIAGPKQLAIQRARSAFLVMEERKIGISGFYKFASIDEFCDVFIDKDTHELKLDEDTIVHSLEDN
ncbi:hypothetical protein A4S06_11760 [Erysipelotrichaceae bacterium MTC7]|nr:hypothetical protein A4S06_11760 [Erysipelotrichaceae bacterium MTC7]